jgi:hypothetical protein
MTGLPLDGRLGGLRIGDPTPGVERRKAPAEYVGNQYLYERAEAVRAAREATTP